MLKEINGNIVVILCPNCEKETEHDITNKTAKFLEEFQEYENIPFDCSHCSTTKIINMNIPLNDTDEHFETGDLPEEEEIQRYYVRVLQRMIREDFIGGNAI